MMYEITRLADAIKNGGEGFLASEIEGFIETVIDRHIGDNCSRKFYYEVLREGYERVHCCGTLFDACSYLSSRLDGTKYTIRETILRGEFGVVMVDGRVYDWQDVKELVEHLRVVGSGCRIESGSTDIEIEEA